MFGNDEFLIAFSDGEQETLFMIGACVGEESFLDTVSSDKEGMSDVGINSSGFSFF